MHTVPREPAASTPRLSALRAGLSRRRRLSGALTGLVVLPLLTLGLTRFDVLNLSSQTLLYLLAVMVVALVGGLLPAVAAAVAAAVLLDHYFIPPLGDFDVTDSHNVVTLVAFVLVAAASSAVVGLAARRREAEALATANAESSAEHRALAEEQAALRRVATLVARGVTATEMFATVAQEVGSVLGADATTIVRLDPDGAITVLTRVGDAPDAIPLGSRWTLEPPLPLAVALRTARPARLDDYSHVPGAYGERVRQLGIRSGVAAPIVVEGRLWGAIAVGSRHGLFPAETDERMVAFTELVGTAMANAEGRAQLEESRGELRGFAEEQAALRRVATLVARAAAPEKVLAAVAEEAGRLLQANNASMSRFEPDGATRVAAAWGNTIAIGTRVGLGGRNVNTLVFETGRPARVDDYNDASGAAGESARKFGIRASVGVPINVGGRLWGVMFVASTSDGPLPADTEARLAGFTELVATAIANAEAQAALTASRERIVVAADAARRRIERDLHDGTQQRLVALGFELRMAHATVPVELPELRAQIAQVVDGLVGTVEELREVSRGIHPSILSEGGLGPALRTLARRAAIPVEVDIRTETRPEDRIEVAAYYVVSEALTNTVKHADASSALLLVEQRDALLHLSIRDDGIGGADPARGSGLIGLRDRVQALGGSIEISSPSGGGTAILVKLPLQPDRPLEPPPDAAPDERHHH